MGAQLCLILCDPMDCSPPDSSVHAIFQPRILEWVAISSSRRSSWPRDQSHISSICCTGRWILYHRATWEAPKLSAASLWKWPKRIIESSYTIFYSVDALWFLNWLHWGTVDIQRPAHAAAAKSLQSCPTLCDPIDGNPPGSSIRGILQARTLEWVAISFSNWLSLDICKHLWCHHYDQSNRFNQHLAENPWVPLLFTLWEEPLTWDLPS